MEVKEWSYEDFPEFMERPEGVEVIETTGDETGVCYLHDVEYVRIDGKPLYLQILIPTSRNGGFDQAAEKQLFAAPCFVFVQGSAWREQNVYGQLAQVAKLAAKGYVCAIVEYRHSGIAGFPAQARDTRNAIRYLRQNAGRYGIDPERMVVAGDSSGGHTAMWAAMLQDDGSTDNHFPGVHAEVKGIVNFYGSTSVMAADSNPMTTNHGLPDSPEGMVMGGQNLLEHPELARALSVECNIHGDTQLPPVLIFHGTKDRVVNCEGSAILYRRLRETGHRARLCLVTGADHGGPEFWTEAVLEKVDEFCNSCFG